MAFAPDGRLFIAEQGGRLRVYKNGELLPTPAVRLAVNSLGERGLLGIAFDPDFKTNQYLYLYYTTRTAPIRNRVSRFTMSGDTVVDDSELILIQMGPLDASNHNGGAIHFGTDGKLYIAVGENAMQEYAQQLSTLKGKMLRINPDGTIPPDNPFYTGLRGKLRAIWALGLRNPFTFAVQPGSGRIFINDVGQGDFEEINEGQRGANYGWPITEGPTSDPRFVPPLYAYSQEAGACAIAGGAFYNPPVRQFPVEYTGDYFFADLVGGGFDTWMCLRTRCPILPPARPVSLVDVQVGPEMAACIIWHATGPSSTALIIILQPRPQSCSTTAVLRCRARRARCCLMSGERPASPTTAACAIASTVPTVSRTGWWQTRATALSAFSGRQRKSLA